MTDKRRESNVADQPGLPRGDAAEPRHRVRRPRFIVHEPVGLGDVINRGTTALGRSSMRSLPEAGRATQSLGAFRSPPLSEEARVVNIFPLHALKLNEARPHG